MGCWTVGHVSTLWSSRSESASYYRVAKADLHLGISLITASSEVFSII